MPDRPTYARPPHRPGATIAADAHLAPSQLIGVDFPPRRHVVFSHLHEFYELAFVIGGHGIHTTDTGEYEVRRGDVVIISPGVSHGYRRSGSLELRNLFVRPELFEFETPWVTHDPHLGSMFSVHGHGPHEPVHVTLREAPLKECLGHLQAMHEARDRATAFGHLALALGILATRSTARTQPSAAPVAAPIYVHAAVDAFERELDARWSLQRLAELLYVHPAHLSREFRRWLGVPPMRYLNDRRVERAALLLAFTSTPIAEIGAAVGWSDPAYFSRRFRSAHGMSPRAYRAVHRGKNVEPTSTTPRPRTAR